ncbi:hypothetical protein BH11PLA2_BH11PLA2_25330 [soil metagenome]
MNAPASYALKAERSRQWFWTNVAIGVAVLSGFGGWAYFRTQSATVKPVEVAKVTPVNDGVTNLVTTSPLAPTPALASTKEDPDDEETPVVNSKPDPELDKLVVSEAKHAGEAQGTKKLPPPLTVNATAARSAKMIAAKIDQLLDKKLAEAKLSVAPVTTDAEFLRRVYLDITGVIPSVAKAKAFLASTDTDKRAKLITDLLADSGYGQNFAHYWHDLLVKRDLDNNKLIKTHDVFLKWLGHQFNDNRPWNEIVHKMITGSGDQALAGETFFVLANVENGQPAPNKIVGTAAALFNGNQMMCAECHVHPMTPEWKQNDFWGLAAFFNKTKAVRANVGKKNLNELATISDEKTAKPMGKGKGKGPAAGTPVPAGSIAIPDPKNEGKFIGTAKASLLDDQPVSTSQVNRTVAADWFTAPTNPFFARAAVNRLWSQFFARGLIDPLDDIRPDSVATHPEVLELLAEEFVASKFDQKHIIEILCRTQAYQRSSLTQSGNKEDNELYSHMAMKVLTPRSLFRSYGVATANQVDLPEEPKIAAKAQKTDSAGQGLAFFDAREYDENPGEYTYGVPQVLRLINTRLPPACDKVAKEAAKLGSKDKVIDHLYLTALSRYPTETERKTVSTFIAKQGDLQKGYSAVMWALLNSAEFVNIH